MGQLRYNVAVSLDGFIARPDGSFDWIVEDATIDFEALYAEFDALVMGRKTYDVVRAQGLSEPFAGVHAVVVSRSRRPGVDGNTTFISEAVAEHVQKLKEDTEKDVWLFGGGELFRHLLDAGLVDTVEVAVMPVLLGQGIPMLAPGASSASLKLTSCVQLRSGIVMLRYDTASQEGVEDETARTG